MSWTEDRLDRLRNKMALAKRQGTWLSVVEAEVVAALITAIRRITLSKG